MNTVDFSYFKTQLYGWISDKISSTVSDVIWADQNAPAPDELYVTLKVLSRMSVGRDYLGKASDAGDASIRGNREVTASIQAFGSDAFQVLADLEEAFRIDLDRSLYQTGIAFIDTEGVLDTSSLIGTEIEERASIDVRLRIGAPFEEVIEEAATGAIEDATITGTADDQQITVNVDT